MTDTAPKRQQPRSTAEPKSDFAWAQRSLLAERDVARLKKEVTRLEEALETATLAECNCEPGPE